MSAFFYYASFPNSRNKNRSATVNANTYEKAVLNRTAPLTLVSPANLNRTYILLTNTDDELTMRYLYAGSITNNPSAVPTFGVVNQLLYNINTHVLYQKQDNGTNTHWNVVLPQNVAEFVLPFQTASLESLGDIYAFSDDDTDGLSIAVDEGRG